MSNLKPTKPMSGMVELLPPAQRCFDECARRMMAVLETAGFNKLDLPLLERAEVLVDTDNWDDIATEIYLFQKGDTKMGLRYDGTVGLARYVAKNMSELAFPFRSYMFGKNYRGERPQRGRYREFYQLDLDVFGIGGLSKNYDAEIVAILSNMYESVREFIGPTNILVGSRTFWNAMFEYLELDAETSRAAFILIDKKDKLGDEFEPALRTKIGDKTDVILSVFSDGYRAMLNKSDSLGIAVRELDDFVAQLGVMGIKNATIDLSIMRGHGYYTGIVFEFQLDNFKELGFVGGGGRYENLCAKFSKTSIVGVGAAVGFSRILVALMDDGKIDLSSFESNTDVCVLTMGSENVAYAMGITSSLRDAGIVTVPYLDADKKFKNQMEFADKIGCKFSVIIGEDEVKDKVVSIKNMTTGEQQKLTLEDAIDIVNRKS